MKRVIRTRKVGDVFVQNGKKYEVVAYDGKSPCLACDMYDGGPDNPCSTQIEVSGLCWAGMRSDNQQVIFKIKE